MSSESEIKFMIKVGGVPELHSSIEGCLESWKEVSDQPAEVFKVATTRLGLFRLKVGFEQMADPVPET